MLLRTQLSRLFGLSLAAVIAFTSAVAAQDAPKKDADAPEQKSPQDTSKPAQKPKSAVPS